ncbi:Uncharacterized protein OS=Isosphaera pallida (strain ATCC 43644 / DSM 9630 / IS1B) GN=Isop_2823 PE=4 SV=1: N_methyl_2 [Gemmata massiliana]|uniref:Prepilin-type N-terminal cleavage/methylation domain-containing protein n=1 Tax=Gemmata massiliana TaxID=1210884 RepID=A0A6P2CQB0_9BACT|nr:type II secretion system protein [Gemmata massiliana]VTR91121.1 Uncharacterized protein OS=Isosphaera pallida (strain ATCC 43644 / DSM 9630 / IS1B) GN=Isop_2823 PE=4 SV=1: N_methyl_2 [Gemmata massiliana]
MTRQSGYRRDGFTLIELLVVISIIAVLVALTTAAVMRGREAVVRADNGWRMEQVTVATNMFCTSAALGQPGNLPPAPFVLKPTYSINEPEAIYLKRIFPNLPVTGGGTTLSVAGLPSTPITLADGNQVAVFFLTGGELMQYQGFSTNGQQPFTPKSASAPDEQRIGPFLQLKANMYSVAPAGITSPTLPANGASWLLDPYGVPYAIFLAGPKGAYLTSAGAAQSFTVTTPTGTSTVNTYYRGSSPVKYENPKTLQIISAGPNKLFGKGQEWSSPATGAGEDDKSNFSTAVIGAGPQ